MKLRDAKVNKRDRPFINNVDGVTVIIREDENKRITEIEVKVPKSNRPKTFKVYRGNILAAWKKVERYFKFNH